MNRRVIILLLLVVIVGGGAAALLLLRPTTPAPDTGQGGGGGSPGQVSGGPTPTPFNVVQILVAVQPIARGGKIRADAVAFRPWDVKDVPQYAITRRPDLQEQEDIARVVDKIARTDIAVEYPILTTLIVDDLTQISTVGSDAAAVIPPGLVAVAIPMDRLTGVAYAVHDGDHVDVIVSFLFVDVDEEFQSKKPNLVTLVTIKQDGTIEFQKGIEGRFEASSFSQFPVVVGPSEPQRPRLLTQRTIQAALVVHVGLFPLDGQFIGKPPDTPTPPPAEGEPTKGPQPPTPSPSFPDIITLAVPPQEAIVLVWAVEARIPMTLALRSAPDTAVGTSTAVTLQYILDTYAIQQPPKLPFALEPAITSIRRLILSGNEINLNSSSSSGGGQGQ